MNSSLEISSLKIYNSTLGLTSRLADIFSVFVLPVVLLIGLLLDFISIYVITSLINKYLKRSAKNPNKNKSRLEIFRYLLLTQISDVLFCITRLFIFIIRCGSYCSLSYSFAAKAYEIYIYLYVSNICALFGMLLEISISINRIMTFSSKKITGEPYKRICFILFIISVIVSAPNYIVSRSVTPIGILETKNNKSEILYGVSNNFIAKNPFGQIILFIIALLRGFILYILLFILNLVIAYKYKIYIRTRLANNIELNSKTNLKYKRKESRVTKMVLAISLVYLILNLPNSLSNIIFTIGIDAIITSNYLIFNDLFLFISHGCFFFVYFYNNKEFMAKSLELLCSLKETDLIDQTVTQNNKKQSETFF